MRSFFVSAIVLPCVLYSGCALYVRHNESAQYRVKILYSNEQSIGAALAGQELLVLPILTRDGPDTTRFITPRGQSLLLGKVRNDLRFMYPETFEKKYKASPAGIDLSSLTGFYSTLFNGKITEAQNSDSVWKAIDAAYLVVIRVKYAATIRGFDGNASRRLTMEIELWNVAASEAVWRAEVVGLDKRPGATDVQFVTGALKEAFAAFPRYVPADNEKDW